MWIGANVIILRGVKIGDGSIIAAGAIVTNDIPMYALAAGIPARVIRMRFEENQIEWLREQTIGIQDPETLSQVAEQFEEKFS